MSVARADLETSTPRMGSAEHRRLLARFFTDTYIEYVPEKIDWPALSDAERRRLTGLPFWQAAVSTEHVTSHTVAAAAALEPVMEEEARHILFFANWVRARRARCARIILEQVASRVKTARALSRGPQQDAQKPSENFTLTAHQALAAPVTLQGLLDKCLEENARRMSRYDARLARPRLVPGIARLLHRLLPARL